MKRKVTPVAKFFAFDGKTGDMVECEIVVPEEEFINGCHSTKSGSLELSQSLYDFHDEIMKRMSWDEDEESQVNKALHEKGLTILAKVVESFKGQ